MDQKCARYWPNANEVEEFERFYIRNLSESNVQTDQGKTVDDLILRWLELRCGSNIFGLFTKIVVIQIVDDFKGWTS